jgi:hypothetical protein
MSNPGPPSKEALTAIYQADQARISAIGSAALTMLGADLTYVVTTTPFAQGLAERLKKSFHADLAAGVFLVILPSLLWVIAAYMALLTIEAATRTVSARVIEQKLIEYAQLKTGRHKDTLFGFEGSDAILDFNQAKWPHRLASLVAYTGIFAITILYTGVMIALAGKYICILSATIVYVALAAVVTLCWTRGLRDVRKSQRNAGFLSRGERRAWIKALGRKDR